MKAFTLIELLAAIVILGLLSTIVYLAVSSTIQDSKAKAEEIQKENIIAASKLWTIENDNQILSEINLSGNYELSVSSLIQSGLLKEETSLNGCVIITCSTSCNQYNYNYGECTNVNN